MTSFPSGVPDADTQILLNLDDNVLMNVCRSNTYLNNLCNDYFWYKRLIIRGYSDFIYLKDQGQFPTYRELYIKLVIGDTYMVIFDDNPYFHSNINDAYQTFITWLSFLSGVDIINFPPIERASEIGNLVSNSHARSIEIYKLIDNIEIHMGDNRFLLLGVNNIPGYNIGQQIGNIKFTIVPNLSQLPILNKTNTYIFYIRDVTNDIFDTNTIISIDKIESTEKNNQTLSRLARYGSYRQLLGNKFLVATVDDNYQEFIMKRKPRRLFHYVRNSFFINDELPVLVIDWIQNNFSIAPLLPGTYSNLQYHRSYDISGVLRPIATSGLIHLPQIPIYLLLQWEPISNIVNYPINYNYLQTIGLRI